MKKLILITALLLTCQILTCQNWDSIAIETTKNMNLHDFSYFENPMPAYPNYKLDYIMPSMPAYPRKTIIYLDSTYWGTELTYPESIEFPKLQYDFKPEKRWKLSEPAKVILLFSSSVILEAIGDAKYDQGQKELGKLFQAASVGLLVASPFLLDINKSKWGWYFASYVSMRVALFDPVYNLSRGLHMGYTGNTSFWDKGVQMFDPPYGMKVFGHSVIFIFAISIPINQL